MLNDLGKRLSEQGSVVVNIKVKAGAPRTEIKEAKEEVWKADIKAQPEKGKANQELIRLLASTFGVDKKNVKIITGKSSLFKRVKIQK